MFKVRPKQTYDLNDRSKQLKMKLNDLRTREYSNSPRPNRPVGSTLLPNYIQATNALGGLVLKSYDKCRIHAIEKELAKLQKNMREDKDKGLKLSMRMK